MNTTGTIQGNTLREIMSSIYTVILSMIVNIIAERKRMSVYLEVQVQC